MKTFFAIVMALGVGLAQAQAAPDDVRERVNQTINGSGRIHLKPILNRSGVGPNQQITSIELVTRSYRNDSYLTLSLNGVPQDRQYARAGSRSTNLYLRNRVSARQVNTMWVDVQGTLTVDSVIIHTRGGNNNYPPGPGNPGGPGYPPPGGPGYPQRYEDVTCSSYKPLSSHCAPSRGGRIARVELIRQISGDACIYGRTWYYDSTGVTVTNGCRGVFRITSY